MQTISDSYPNSKLQADLIDRYSIHILQSMQIF